MSDLSIEQAIDELRDLVRCRCHPAFTERKLHDPDCNCDSAEAVEVLANALPAVQPDAREVALREAAALAETVSDKWREEDDMAKDTCRRIAAAILALLDKSAEPHVKETRKSEHVPGDVLTPATKGAAHD